MSPDRQNRLILSAQIRLFRVIGVDDADSIVAVFGSMENWEKTCDLLRTIGELFFAQRGQVFTGGSLGLGEHVDQFMTILRKEWQNEQTSLKSISV